MNAHPSAEALAGAISLATLRTLFHGTAGLAEDDTGIVPWRLDPELQPFYRPEVASRALMTAGVHLRFSSDCTGLQLEFDLARYREGLPFEFDRTPLSEFAAEETAVDALVDGELYQPEITAVDDYCSLSLSGLRPVTKDIVIYFPLFAMVRVRRLILHGSSVVTPAPSRQRWVTHGSSITHCRRAESPAFTWPAIVGRRNEWDTWNLGFGGQCKFDPVVARVIARMPADRISLCLGINTCAASYSLRTWVPAVEGFIMTVRDGHPTTPLLIIAPILSVPRENCDEAPTTIGLQTMRRTLEEIVAKFTAAGDRQIFYLDGTKLIGPGDEPTMPDQLHPDANGIKLMADRFLAHAPAEWQGPR